MNCKNCGELVPDKFCGHCGQNSKVGKINFPNFLSDLSQSVFLVNSGFFYTLLNLFKRPGYAIKDFLDGKRKKHFKPMAFVLVLSTFYFLISRISGGNTWLKDVMVGFTTYDSGSIESMTSSMTWFSNNFAYTSLLLVPIFSLASFVSFSGKGRNYLEHIVLNAYIAGQQAIIYVFFMLLMMFIDLKALEPVPVLSSMFYTFWVFWQFFDEGNRIVNVIRSIATYIIYMILSSGFLFILWSL